MAFTDLIGGILGKQRVQIIKKNQTIITVDCSVSETHSSESPASEFPIEGGQSITDNIIIKPKALELNGIISDAPLSLLNALVTTGVSAVLPPLGVAAASAGFGLFKALSGSKKPSVVAFAQLLQLQNLKEPFDVLTTLQRYPSMFVKSISVPRDAQNAQVLNFKISLVQLIIVSPQTVNVQVFKDPAIGAGQANLGNQQNSKLKDAFNAGLGAEQSLTQPVFNFVGLPGVH